MTNLIKTIIKTRRLAADIFVNSLVNINSLSEVEISNKILNEAKNYSEIFPEGWYSPPPSGTAVLLDQAPFKRLQYDSLRNPEFWPKGNIYLEKETVGLIYFSPVDRKTGMIGDIGLTIYRGQNQKIRQHLKNCYFDVLKIVEYVQVGMNFSKICEYALKFFQNKYKLTRWVTISSNPNHKINLGHTLPGSSEENVSFGQTFEKIKENIKSKRLHLQDTEHFKIPKTCAFTIEPRLEDLTDSAIPSGYFHFIVCFNKGKKIILDNYQKIFNVVGMGYMN